MQARKTRPANAAPDAVEEARLAALADLGILDTPPDPRLDRLAGLAARLFAAPFAYISFLDRDRQWFKAMVGFELAERAREASFCAHTIQPGGGSLLVVGDTLLDPRFSGNETVAGPPFLRFYAGAPLLANGHKVGTLCVMDVRPRAFSEGDADLLRALAATASDLLGLVAADAERDLHLREVNHRIKNLLSVASSVAELSARNHPEAAAFMEGYRERLRALASASDVLIDRDWRDAEARALVAAVIAQTGLDGVASVAIDLPTARIDAGTAQTLAIVVHELLTNALKYGALSRPGGTVRVSGHRLGEVLEIAWLEEGGPPVSPPQRSGFGLTMIGLASRQAGGAADIDWSPAGILCRLKVPLAKPRRGASG